MDTGPLALSRACSGAMRHNRAVTLWSGRVGASLDPAVWELLRANDAELLPYDCEATAEHAGRLHGAGLLDAAELAEVEERLAEIAQDPSAILDADEDVHSAIERLLGPAGRKVHAGRSRNDQVAAAFRLYVRDACAEAREEIDALALVTLSFAEAEADTLMPGYTHLQRGQPVTLGHHLLAWVEMLDRDRTRFTAAGEAASTSPLGSGALAGSTLGIDPPMAQMRNSIDAVADRDFALDYLYAAAMLAQHLSRIGEEIVLWSTAEFGFVKLPENASTGSSMMPQKLNPDVAELVRGKGGHGDRPARRPPRDGEGAPARLRPRPPGGQGAGLRRPAGRPALPARDDRARQRARRGSRAARRGGRRPTPPRDRRRRGSRARGHSLPRRARAGCGIGARRHVRERHHAGRERRRARRPRAGRSPRGDHRRAQALRPGALEIRRSTRP